MDASLSITRDHWRAMGSAVELLVVAGTADLAHLTHLTHLARRTIDQLEQCWSRFAPASDITRINLAGGETVVVDPVTIDLLQRAIEGWAATDGAFDPTQLAPLVEAGYDASWEDPTHRTFLPAGVARRVDPSTIRLDRASSTVTAPAGIGVDAGAIGKGLAADLTVAALLEAGAEGAIVSIGGDLRVAGTPPEGSGWHVAVAEDARPTGNGLVPEQLHLLAGGVATSGISRHAWRDRTGLPTHHVIDPLTGRPSTGVREATVVAGTGAWAEIWATALVVAGPTRVVEALDAIGGAAAWTDADGARHRSARWHDFTGGTGSPSTSTTSTTSTTSMTPTTSTNSTTHDHELKETT